MRVGAGAGYGVSTAAPRLVPARSLRGQYLVDVVSEVAEPDGDGVGGPVAILRDRRDLDSPIRDERGRDDGLRVNLGGVHSRSRGQSRSLCRQASMYHDHRRDLVQSTLFQIRTLFRS